jgi:hypothetical protein
MESLQEKLLGTLSFDLSRLVTTSCFIRNPNNFIKNFKTY